MGTISSTTLRRAAFEACAVLERASLKVEPDVHAARQAIKQLFAYWQLARHVAANPVRRAALIDLKALHHQLAPQRDITVRAHLLRRWQSRWTQPAEQRALQHFEERTRGAVAPLPSMEFALRVVQNERDRWHSVHLNAAAIQHNLGRTRQRTIKSKRRAKESLRGKDLHRWRKWAKHRGYQLALIPGSKKKRKRLERLGDRLGKLNDLMSFRQQAREHLPDEDRDCIERKLDKRITRAKRNLLAR